MKNLLLILLLATACKAYRPIDTVSREIPKENRSKSFVSRQLDQISPGDSLQINLKNGITYEMIYQTTRNDSLSGLFWKKNIQRFKVPIESSVHVDQIDSLKIRRFSLGATIGITSSILLVSGLIGFFTVQSALSSIHLW